MIIEKAVPKDLADEEYWKKLSKGCKKSFEMLYFRHHKKLYNYAVKFCGDPELAEDQVQALFLKIWEKRERFTEVKYVRTYLWVALRRIIAEKQNKEKKLQSLTVHSNGSGFQIASSPEDFILISEYNSELLEKLFEAMQELSPRQREILYLKYYEGMSYKEIETITSLRYQTIRNHVYDGVKKLKAVMKPQGERTLLTLTC